MYKELVGDLLRKESLLKEELKEAKQKVDELETELYFCRRNRRIEDEVQEGEQMEIEQIGNKVQNMAQECI